jgi:carbamoyltransferase
MQYLGLGKTKFNSSICLLDSNSCEILLTERYNRKKNSGAWPYITLQKISNRINLSEIQIGENSDVLTPHYAEEEQNKIYPFYEFLKKEKLEQFTIKNNPNIVNVNHHMAHAYAALSVSPFEKSIILVIDGAGSQFTANSFEECSFFLQDGNKLECVYQRPVHFTNSPHSPHKITGNQIGSAYECIANFIFNSNQCSGKVMGLAPFGNADSLEDLVAFQNSLDWNNSFKGNSKEEWKCSNSKLFQDLAATIQKAFEDELFKIIEIIKNQYVDYTNLIITGGCALNCTFNAKLYYRKIFDKIFIPHFPGDESISFGIAKKMQLLHSPNSWRPIPFENQTSFLGSLESIPMKNQIIKTFISDNKYEVVESNNISEHAANLIAENNIVCWFQGRSETGPRALGNRSILANPKIPNLKNILNKHIKFREDFRPYGCSTLIETASTYFEVEDLFSNPFMSYAIKVKPEYYEILNEVMHIDRTSRMQTVEQSQNEKFYRLIDYFGKKTNLFCLLNTSFNIMNEPIVETVEDAKRFMDQSKIKYLIIDNFIITNNSIHEKLE